MVVTGGIVCMSDERDAERFRYIAEHLIYDGCNGGRVFGMIPVQNVGGCRFGDAIDRLMESGRRYTGQISGKVDALIQGESAKEDCPAA